MNSPLLTAGLLVIFTAAILSINVTLASLPLLTKPNLAATKRQLLGLVIMATVGLGLVFYAIFS